MKQKSIQFKNKKLNFKKLSAFGFIKADNHYEYNCKILDNEFNLEIKIQKNGLINTRLTELSNNEIYTLHLVESSSGDFVGKIKEEYQFILDKIKNECFDDDIFKSAQIKRIIEYVKNKYGDELEFLWEKTPNAAIWRRKDSKKWYGIIMSVLKNRLIKSASGDVEIMNVKLSSFDIEKFVDYKNYFPAYHMNKKHWLSIILDNQLNDDEIISKIDASYILAAK